MKQNMDKFNLKVPFLVTFAVLSAFPETACVEVFTFTTTASVRPGTNRLSCFPLEKANEQGIKVFHASWHQRPGENHEWSWLGGVRDPNNLAEIRYANGTDTRYILYANATLEILNVTKGDNDTEYMCTGRGGGFRESLIYKLSFYEPEESTSQNCTCPACNCTEALGAANGTTDNSATDGKCTTWIIGFGLLLLVCLRSYIIVSLRVVWEKIRSCCTYQRNATFNPPITNELREESSASTANELREESSASNGNVNCGEDFGEHESRELEGPYGVPESNGDNGAYITESVD